MRKVLSMESTSMDIEYQDENSASLRGKEVH